MKQKLADMSTTGRGNRMRQRLQEEIQDSGVGREVKGRRKITDKGRGCVSASVTIPGHPKESISRTAGEGGTRPFRVEGRGKEVGPDYLNEKRKKPGGKGPLTLNCKLQGSKTTWSEGKKGKEKKGQELGTKWSNWEGEV